MVIISYTNIIVDEFSTARNNPFNKYIHFLTHIHTDHLKGLSNSWDYGTIYCSSITKKLILLKFPRLSKCLKQLQLQTQHTISLSTQLQVTVTLFDSNHCAGGVMLLIQGYMGNILYTGDLRFDKQIFSSYTYLYPHHKRNKQFIKCSIPIDFLYLDVTFLHPKFCFPSKGQAMRMLEKFIQDTINNAKKENKFIQFYIGMDNFGKEQVLINLAEKFSTMITISEDRYKNISTIGLETGIFTTYKQAGFIHVILKRQLKKQLSQNQNAVGIILTGWANQPHYRSKKLYAIPYSLHSSYPQLNQFVNSIRPSFIQSILDSQNGNNSQQNSISLSSKDPLDNNLYQSINYVQFLNKFRSQYCIQPSTQLKQLMGNYQLQKKIKEKLKLDRTSVQINREEFGMNTVRLENFNRSTGIKLNFKKSQQEIQKIKEKIKEKKDDLISKTINQLQTKRISRKTLYNQQISLIDQDENENVINTSEDKSKNSSKNTSMESQNSNNSRKQKWKKQIQKGAIDLFGQIPQKKQKQNKQHQSASFNNMSTIDKYVNKNKQPINIDNNQQQQNIQNQTLNQTQTKRKSNLEQQRIFLKNKKVFLQDNSQLEQQQISQQVTQKHLQEGINKKTNKLKKKQIKEKMFKAITNCQQENALEKISNDTLFKIKQVDTSNIQNFFVNKIISNFK